MDKELKKIWFDEYLVNWYEADLTGKAKISSICNYLQESAWRHANHLGFGFEDAKMFNQVWVIIGLMVRMLKYPSWGDTIKVETWPKGIDRLFAFRDFRIMDNNGNLLGAATSSWMILDVKTRRPQKVEIVRPVLHLLTHQDVLKENPPHLPPLAHGVAGYKRQVLFSELDFNGHVNNTRYIDWCMDAFPMQHHVEFRAHTFLINYLSETLINEEIELKADDWEPPINTIEGMRTRDNKAIFRARVDWEKK